MKKKQKLVVFIVEGDTELEFYKQLVLYYRGQHAGWLNCKIEYKSVDGVGKYKGKGVRIFKNIISQYPKSDYVYHVFLCYDADVFEFGQKPKDWKSVVESLKKSGARVVQVRAVHSIEDWFLYDTEGLRRFLHLTDKIQKKGSGLEYLQDLFKKANRMYNKGHASKGLIAALDMSVIISHIGSEIKKIEDEFKSEEHLEDPTHTTEAHKNSSQS